MAQTEKQRQESWHNMKLHLAGVVLDVVKEDPKNLNTLNKCYDYIQKNFDIMACVKQIDSRTKDWLWVLLDDKEMDVKYLTRRVETISNYLLKQKEEVA